MEVLAALGGAQQRSWQSICFPNIHASALSPILPNAKRSPDTYRLFTPLSDLSAPPLRQQRPHGSKL